MNSFRFRMAHWVVVHRRLLGVLFVLITIGFSFGLPNVQLKTIFNHMLPLDDPFVHTYFAHPNFGSPLTVSIMVQAKKGTIYQKNVLQDVWDLSRGIDLAPSVDHNTIMSIATSKLRFAQATPQGIILRPLMGGHVPTKPKEVAGFKKRIDQSPAAHTFFVSPDASSTLITAQFLDTVEYGETFKFIRNLVEKQRTKDPNVNIYVAGQPMKVGWVYSLEAQTNYIFLVTIVLLTLALILYMRNITGVVAPLVCAAVAGWWAFGFIGLADKPIEPLLMVIPLLLVARTFSHCIQYTERYYEILTHVKDKHLAAELTLAVMVSPSILGIFTDVFGISFIALAPTVMLYNHALFCGMWAFFIIPCGVYLLSILLPTLPMPKNIDRIAGVGKQTGVHLFARNVLTKIGSITHGRAAWGTGAVTVIVSGLAIWYGLGIPVGNPTQGTSILWDDSVYNVSVKNIDEQFPGMNTLDVVFEAKQANNLSQRVARTPGVYVDSLAIQRYMESQPGPGKPAATLSFSDYMMQGNRLFNGGNPKWLPLDPTVRSVRGAGTAIAFGADPANFGQVSDFLFQNSAVVLYYKDNTQKTVDASLDALQDAVNQVGTDHHLYRIRMASGTIALQHAMNYVVERYHWIIMALLDLAIIIISTYAYKSIVAAIILMVPVNIATFLLLSLMRLLGIGFDMNALIVAVLGVGIGIDYGIYLLSRIAEEYTAQDRDWGRAINEALETTGKAILFTASVMLVGIIPWYFLSDLRFMAQMGELIVFIMLINMVLALIVLPMVVWFIKPGFADREDMALGENLDFSQFVDADGNVKLPSSE
ncbi:MAG: efflux RND transporter permease subunit [Sinobacteraceae bacterium]|nr:efflux RND transporter permease subunit [Nevskiaceae bacterium]